MDLSVRGNISGAFFTVGCGIPCFSVAWLLWQMEHGEVVFFSTLSRGLHAIRVAKIICPTMVGTSQMDKWWFDSQSRIRLSLSAVHVSNLRLQYIRFVELSSWVDPRFPNSPFLIEVLPDITPKTYT